MKKPNKLFRVWSFISPYRKFQVSLVYVLVLLSSFAEVLTIGAVIPFIGVLTNPDLISQNEVLVGFLLRFKSLGQLDPVELITALFIIAVLVAALIRIFLLVSQTKVSHAIGLDLGYQIYKKTLYQPYEFHMENNSSDLVGTVSNKVSQVVMGVILPGITLLGYLTLIFAVLSFLLYINTQETLLAITGFSLSYFLIILATRKRLKINSILINENTNRIVKIVQEGIGGIRDIIIDGTQETYANLYKSTDTVLRGSLANNQIIGQSPKYAIEALAVVLIAFFVYHMSTKGHGIDDYLPMLAALALGGQRILPMLQQVFAAWSSIIGSSALIDDVMDLAECEPVLLSYQDNLDNLAFKNKITLEGVSFAYAGFRKKVLNNIDISISKGDWVGIVGPSGSGKSTVLDIIMSLLLPTEGRLRVDARSIDLEVHRGWQQQIAHIPQNIFISDATVEENIAFGERPGKINRERLLNAAKIAQIDSVIDLLPYGYKTILGERGARLSGGQRQRIGIARALYKRVSVLILDEATSALDPMTEARVMEGLQSLSSEITVIVVAHRVSTLHRCDYIIHLKEGRVAKVSSYEELTL